MAFEFPLQAVLHFRQSIEHQEELRLRNANQQVAKVRHWIERIDEILLQESALRSESLVAGTTAAELRFSVLTRESLTERRRQVERELARLENLRDKQQRIFQHARRERETIESLRDRQLLEYRQNAARREQRRADEFFLLRQFYLRRG